MIIVKGKARFAPGEIERLRPALARFVEETRHRDGCLAYHYAVDLMDPDLMHTVENWRDQAAKDAHLNQMDTLLVALEGAQMDGLLVKAYEARFLENVLGDEAELTANPDGISDSRK